MKGVIWVINKVGVYESILDVVGGGVTLACYNGCSLALTVDLANRSVAGASPLARWGGWYRFISRLLEIKRYDLSVY